MYTHTEAADGPRWLISKGRKDDAVNTLEKVRPEADVAAGHCRAEVEAIQEAINNQIEKGPWVDLFVSNLLALLFRSTSR